jgi:hypothetical protein
LGAVLAVAGAGVIWLRFGFGALLECLTFVALALGILALLLMVGPPHVDAPAPGSEPLTNPLEQRAAPSVLP